MNADASNSTGRVSESTQWIGTAPRQCKGDGNAGHRKGALQHGWLHLQRCPVRKTGWTTETNGLFRLIKQITPNACLPDVFTARRADVRVVHPSGSGSPGMYTEESPDGPANSIN